MTESAQITAFVQVTGELPMHCHVSPHTGRLDVRLGRACPVTLSFDHVGLMRLVSLLEQGRDHVHTVEDSAGRHGRWEPG